jgi:hypothetical protein
MILMCFFQCLENLCVSFTKMSPLLLYSKRVKNYMQEHLSNPRKIVIMTSIMLHYSMQPPLAHDYKHVQCKLDGK